MTSAQHDLLRRVFVSRKRLASAQRLAQRTRHLQHWCGGIHFIESCLEALTADIEAYVVPEKPKAEKRRTTARDRDKLLAKM